jgi:thiol:disulfide interchange protein DsbD
MAVQRFGAILGLCLAACVIFCSQAQLPSFDVPGSLGSTSAHHTQAKLVLSADTVKPGDTIWAGVDMKMDPGWHTYWKNSGEAGMPTKITWQLPAGISAGDIQWPLPEKFPPVEVTTYGYDNETMLLVPLTIASNLPPDQFDLKANASWLECKDVCIPANQDVEATLTIGAETKTSEDAATIESWEQKVPESDNPNAPGYLPYTNTAWWEKPADGDTRALIIDRRCLMPLPANVPFDNADFYPDAYDPFEVQPTTQNLGAGTSGMRLRLSVKKYSGDWPKEISGLLVTELRGQRQGTVVTFSISDQPLAGMAATVATASLASANTGSGAGETPALPLMLLYAFIGGLILNIMPCVLPVIALKILGFVSEARSEPRRVRNLGFLYGFGVLASFLVLAGIVIGVEAAGHRAGWGMQFGNPIFVVCLTILVTLVALNLFGVFEITPGGAVMDAAGKLASKHGASGAFFNGVLATALATPCTAPVLASALGFAFSQNRPSIIILVFLFIGLGLAAPYVLLSCNPALMKFLPKPGPWMQKFKIAMGFPMLATVVWLFNVASEDYGNRVFWLGVFLVILSLAAWIYGEFVQRGQRGKGVALVLTLLLLAGGYAYALEGHLHWREMAAETSASAPLSSGGIDWQAWSDGAVAQARAAGKPVLVDFTARWCVTCNAIVKPALENAAVSEKLKAIGAVPLLADYTRTPADMTAAIAQFGSAGVPLVLVYPKDPSAPAIVLPQPSPLQLPSTYSKLVLDALNRAAN